MTRIALIVAATLAGCAYIEPIPCENLEWPSAGGPRTYPELCQDMKTTVQIRPEQAAQIRALDAKVKDATHDRDLALKIALAGLVNGQALVQTIDDDGIVTLEVSEED